MAMFRISSRLFEAHSAFARFVLAAIGVLATTACQVESGSSAGGMHSGSTRAADTSNGQPDLTLIASASNGYVAEGLFGYVKTVV